MAQLSAEEKRLDLAPEVLVGQHAPGPARLLVDRLPPAAGAGDPNNHLAPRLTVLDPQALSPAQLAATKALFERFKGETFRPANEAYRDETRQALDRAVLVELLDLSEEVMEPLSILRDQWCDEPSVHGGKTTRIGDPRTDGGEG